MTGLAGAGHSADASAVAPRTMPIVAMTFLIPIPLAHHRPTNAILLQGASGVDDTLRAQHARLEHHPEFDGSLGGRVDLEDCGGERHPPITPNRSSAPSFLTLAPASLSASQPGAGPLP